MRKKGKFRRYFLTGVITILPILITVLLLLWFWSFLSDKLIVVPQKLFPENPELMFPLQIAALIILILIITLIGYITSKVVGKTILKFLESLITKIPLLRGIYSTIKQIPDSLSAGGKKSSRQVVLVEYPRKGLYAIGFVTTDMSIIENKKMITVYIPTAPNPTSGYMILCRKKELKVLNLTVDQGLKMIISAGMLAPKEL